MPSSGMTLHPTFKRLKITMVATLTLALPTFFQPFVIETSAFSVGIGVALMQQGHCIIYLNKALATKQ